MTPLDLDDLLAKAKAATPGPWCAVSDLPSWAVAAMDGRDPITTKNRVYRRPDRVNGGCDERDAAFIAAANPTTMIALVERVREAERSARIREHLVLRGRDNFSDLTKDFNEALRIADDLKQKLAIAVAALEFIDKPKHDEPDDYTRVACFQFRAFEALKKIRSTESDGKEEV